MKSIGVGHLNSQEQARLKTLGERGNSQLVDPSLSIYTRKSEDKSVGATVITEPDACFFVQSR